MFDSQLEGLGVAFFATGPGLGLIMYIFTTLELPTHNFDFHLLTTSVNAKYYYLRRGCLIYTKKCENKNLGHTLAMLSLTPLSLIPDCCLAS